MSYFLYKPESLSLGFVTTLRTCKCKCSLYKISNFV